LLKPHAFEAVKVANAGYSIQAKATVAAIEPKVVKLEAIHTKANATAGANQSSETGVAQLATIHLSADKGKTSRQKVLGHILPRQQQHRQGWLFHSKKHHNW
jgi:hypothetical protein